MKYLGLVLDGQCVWVAPGAFPPICSATRRRSVCPILAHAECGRPQRYVWTAVRGGHLVDDPVSRTGVCRIPDCSFQGSSVASIKSHGGQGHTRLPHGGDGASVPVGRDSPELLAGLYPRVGRKGCFTPRDWCRS